MRKLFAILAILAVWCIPVAAEVRSVHVCEEKTITASTTTDCAYTDISAFTFFSYQVYCNETTGDSMSIDVDWVGGSAAGSDYMGIPILVSGSAMSQLKTAYTTEAAWSVLASIQPPVSPVGTIRLTENNADADIVCTVILNMGN